MSERILDVLGAAEHNLRDVDVTFGPGLTAVVGVSGSGKSSLAFDVVYNEARRRFMETLSLGSPTMRVPPAHVRRIDGLGPAVAIAQNVLNRNPGSTLATSVGLHPFFRILWSKFADVSCAQCEIPVRAVSSEERLRIALDMLDEREDVDVEVAIVRAVPGTHGELLSGLRSMFDVVTVDGKAWKTRGKVPRLDAAAPHDVVASAGRITRGMSAADVRAELERADALGTPEVRLGGVPVLREPICPSCGTWLRPLEPTAFRPGGPDTSSHTISGLTLTALLGRTVVDVLRFVEDLPVGLRAQRLQDELLRRLRPLVTLGLAHLTLDRPMPTLSRGEAQRTRLAVVLSGRLEDLLHVLDEPTIGLHHTDLQRLLDAIASLPGPVVMVEHDRTAVAMADDVVEIGPGGGTAGGTVVFQGAPAALWKADTASGRGFSSQVKAQRSRRQHGDEAVVVRNASARNLRGLDCEIPLGLLTVITGPSGAGKTTLSRDVILASLEKGIPHGCDSVEAPVLRAIAVDQSPLGNNPRSNPATYTKVFDRIRDVFATASGRSPSEFTFNRAEGACPECEGSGAVEIKLRYVQSVWVDCEACEGTRYKSEVLQHRWNDMSIADVLASTVDDACELFAGNRAITRILDTLREIGLGYITLGQPSPSLSGGEAQRVRLTREVSKAKSGDLVLLDEPTTGLHPADLGRLIGILDALTAKGCTVVVVEHQPDVIASADWVIDLGPGGGPDGGELMHCGPPKQLKHDAPKPRAKPRSRPRASDAISVRGARAHNLQGIDVDFPKGKFTVVTGVSGSGKSSLVDDVLAAEATRRFLECLSVYERESVREGPEAPVDSITGLGPTLIVEASSFVPGGPGGEARATVGGSTGLDGAVALVIARAGDRTCDACGSQAVRRTSPLPDLPWRCDDCGQTAVPIEPRHLTAAFPWSVCKRCYGLGIERRLIESKLVRRPDVPVCAGAINADTNNWYGRPGGGGYAVMMAFARRHGFDPHTTPWNEMPAAARHAFLYGDPDPYPIVAGQLIPYEWPRSGGEWRWRGIGTARARFDIGGAISEAIVCTLCDGKRLRPEYLTIRLGGLHRADLFSMPLTSLETTLDELATPDDSFAADARTTALRRLSFLRSVGLGYLHMDRPTRTLSAGEAQRIRLASIIRGGLRGMTILLDEPSRGLHPSEVDALARTLRELRSAGNTVIAVEHDATFIRAADNVIEIGPGPGRHGGRLIDVRSGESVTRPLLEGRRLIARPRPHREPNSWMRIVGATENNLSGADVRIPLGVQVGVCGVSGSGKSSLIVDTLSLALVRPRLTNQSEGIYIRMQPGAHDAIEGAPARTIVADQSRAAIPSPGMYLGLIDAVRKAFASDDAALDAGLTVKDLLHGCDACHGRGTWRESMWFLPSVAHECDACGGTGYHHEAAELRHRGLSLADAERLTIADLADAFGDIPAIGRTCDAALRLGLGYLVIRQPGWSLSGGEAQRLKLAKELARRTTAKALYLLDEPTLGLQATDVAVLAKALDEVVDAGHTVLLVEHEPDLLACCDWLIELGPGAGPAGGKVIFEGTPEDLAKQDTPTSPYIREVLG